MLRFDYSRAFSCRNICLLPIVFGGIAYIVGLDSIIGVMGRTEALESGWVFRFVTNGLQQQSIQMLIPVFAALPFAASFIEEWKSGMLRHTLSRISRQRFLLSKIVTTAVSGGTVLAIGAVLFMISGLLIFARMETPVEDMNIQLSYVTQYSQQVLRYFLAGALWAEIGLIISTWLNYRFMAWLSPCIVYYLLIILYERYFSWCHVIYPQEWIVIKHQWPFGQWGVCLWLLCMIFAVGIIFYLIGERKLQNV